MTTKKLSIPLEKKFSHLSNFSFKENDYIVTPNSLQVIQCIFVPNKKQLERLKKSLNSFSHLPFNSFTIDIYMDGWVATDNLWRELMEFIDKLPIHIFYINKRSINFGKAKIINRLISFNRCYEYVLCLDSDIIIEKNSIEKLIGLHVKNPNSILVCNQKEDCRHNIFVQSLSLNNELFSSKPVIGIAGGAFLTNPNYIRICPLKEKGPYSPEDITFFNDIQKYGYEVYLCKNIYIIHPFDDDKEYKIWKENLANQLYNKDLNKKEYESLIENSHKFWINKDKE